MNVMNYYKFNKAVYDISNEKIIENICQCEWKNGIYI